MEYISLPPRPSCLNQTNELQVKAFCHPLEILAYLETLSSASWGQDTFSSCVLIQWIKATVENARILPITYRKGTAFQTRRLHKTVLFRKHDTGSCHSLYTVLHVRHWGKCLGHGTSCDFPLFCSLMAMTYLGQVLNQSLPVDDWWKLNRGQHSYSTDEDLEA